MKPKLLLTTLDAAALAQTLTAHAGRLRFVYLESETRVLLTYLADYLAGTLPPARWRTGRAFGTTLEIRWTRDELMIDGQMLYETADDAPDPDPVGWTPAGWTFESAQARDVLLIGAHVRTLPPDHALHDPNGGAWFAESAARRLEYPVDAQAERVALRCLDYLSGGIAVMTRLCDVIPYRPS